MLSRLRRLPHLLRLGWRLRRLRRAVGPREEALARAALARQLADGRGLSMKLGQVYADRSGAAELSELLDGVEPLPLESVLPLIETALEAPPENHFAWIDPHGIAASLGQVHRARLLDGREVALKVRYPDIEQTLEAEMAVAGLIPGVGPARRWGFDLEGYRRTLRENFARELDYTSEAERQSWLYQQLRVPGLVIPAPVESLCRPGLLVQGWEEGVPLREAQAWPLGERLQIGRTLLMTLFQSLFTHGELHGDPHAGNLRARRGGQGVETLLYDFGCTLTLVRERRLALLRLLLSLRGEAPPVAPLHALTTIGFDPAKLAHLSGEGPAIARLLFKPFLIDAPFAPAQWGLGEGFEQLLGVRRWWFRSAGPADILLLMRVFQGVTNHLERLEVRLPWWPLLVQAVGEPTLTEARELVLPPPPAKLSAEPTPLGQAQRLHVQLSEAGELKVDLELPADAALELAELIPADLAERIEADHPGALIEAQARAAANGLAKQALFTWETPGRRVQLWLE